MSLIACAGRFVEIVILYYCLTNNLERRYSVKKVFLIFFLVEIMNIIKCIIMPEISMTKTVTTVVLNLLLLSILFKDKWYKKIVVYMTFLLSTIFAEVLAIMIAKYVYHSNLADINEFSPENVLWSVTTYLFLFIFCVLGAMFLKNKKINEQDRVTQYVFLYIGMQFVLVTLFFAFVCEFRITEVTIMFVLLFVVAMCFIIAMKLFNTVKTMSKKSAEAEFIKKESEIKDKHFFEIKEQYMEYRKLRHDFYNHIKVLENMDEGDKIKAYINEVKDRFDKMERVSYCNNPSIDALLSLKAKEAEANGIKTLFEVCDMTKVTISDFDMCSVVANLLDNAIEAAKNTKDKYIDLEINLKADRIILVVKNSSSEPEKALKTTKRDTENHGIGLESIKETAKKYDGDCVFKFSDGEFVSVVNMRS